ncbi:DUF4258 domain-containing protein [Virgibacillus halodenitrificans]|uniref:DUF4258 domain-containing protein n=1 Tax=Virgibacillus halodenitrificans TaxID=1482 RepID=UPI000EF5081C|nr:DUF4258 domain-containing protein [Virgibacillus halodenitrificans]
MDNNHFEQEWFHEIRLMREAMIGKGNSKFEISKHTFEERMSERDISIIEMAEVILTGTIIEGFDVGKYPKYRNPDMIRNIVGETKDGKLITVCVAFSNYDEFKITTVYEGVTNRVLNCFQSKCPELYQKHFVPTEEVIATVN